MRNSTVVTSVVAIVALGGAGCGDNNNAAIDAPSTAPFSFFVTSVRALQELSGNQAGFGGDLRYGETGPGAGLRGADAICAAIAERSMPGASAKRWRAFLSASDDGTGHGVNAIDRIGAGPWYDRTGRLFAPTISSLLSDRPVGADALIADDFPNEDGVPNHDPDLTGDVDNHDMLTGTNDRGLLYASMSTCLDWTSSDGDVALTGRPRVGHSWGRAAGPGPIDGDGGIIIDDDGGMFPPDDGGMPPPPPPGDGGMMMPPDDGGFMQGSGNNWMSALDESGCAPGINLIETGPPDPNSNTVGSGGGYGGFYCFALEP